MNFQKLIIIYYNPQNLTIMITKIDSNSIIFDETNFKQLIDKHNLLVELYYQSVHCQIKYQELYEVNFEETRILKEQNISLLLQMDKFNEIQNISN